MKKAVLALTAIALSGSAFATPVKPKCDLLYVCPPAAVAPSLLDTSTAPTSLAPVSVAAK